MELYKRCVKTQNRFKAIKIESVVLCFALNTNQNVHRAMDIKKLTSCNEIKES